MWGKIVSILNALKLPKLALRNQIGWKLIELKVRGQWDFCLGMLIYACVKLLGAILSKKGISGELLPLVECHLVELQMEELTSLEKPGGRLTYLLDSIGFKKGRGRIRSFYQYLVDANPESFGDLKYGAVKSWFNESTPSMSRVDDVIDALHSNFSIGFELPLIKSWWVIGGFNPFEKQTSNVTMENVQQTKELFDFVVQKLIAEELLKLDRPPSIEDLSRAKIFVLGFIEDFADSKKTACPLEYIKMATKYALDR